jgi:uncharacterized repeat protein (TIGR01451 family)
MKIWQRIVAVVSTFALLVNSLAAPLTVLAQEATPGPTPEATVQPIDTPTDPASPTPEATIEATTTPTVTPDTTPAEIATPTPEITPVATDLITPVPSDQPVETQAPESNPTTQGPPASDQPAATPTVTPEAPTENGHIAATILQNTTVDTSTIDQYDLTYQTDGSATISTDKLDYAPTDSVLITGVGFIAGKTYTINVTSSDAPPVNFSDSVTANDKGEIVYSYQLDGNFRPNYQVAVKDLERVVASTMFTDSSGSLSQCGNGTLASPDPTPCQSDTEWENGNLGASKSHYFEGDTIPYRLTISGLSTSGSHTATVEWDTTKSSKHAIDYITSFNNTVTTADPCAGITGCSLFSTHTIPTDSQVTAAGVTPIPGDFRLYGGTITAVSAYSYHDGTGFSGDKSARITITFTTSVTNPVLAWGGHIADRFDWGAENSAVAISGSPYHTRLIEVDGSGGNQDRSLSAGAVVFPGSITIIKDATPNGSTSFAFTGSPSPLTNFSLIDDGTSANTEVFSGITNFQTYIVNETPIPSGWGFDSVSCNLTSPNGGSSSTSTTTATINMNEGENYTCTYLDSQRSGTLTVIKHVINDNGGVLDASDFTLHVKSGDLDVSGSPAAGNESGTVYSLIGGAYVVSENTPPAGYTQTGFSGDCDSGGNVIVVAGQTKTCTITNNDNAPSLTLVKAVTNNNGGASAPSDWTLTASGPTGFSGAGPTVNNGVSFDAGTYTLSESGPIGYSASDWVCVGGTQGNATHITITLGQSATCTITNDDVQPQLTVVKTVHNNFGGLLTVGDFPLFVNGNGVASGTTNGFDVGTYTVTETQQTGYASGGFGGDCDSNGHVTLAVGDNKTCTLENHDVQPKLTLVKTVINDNGGTLEIEDFPLFVDAIGVTSGVTNGFNAGSYTASETQQPGYAASIWGGDCATNGSVTLAVGDNKTCTITNNDIQPKLTLTKVVVNNFGGNAVISNFPLFVDSTQVVSGVQNGFNAGVRTASETNLTGYTPGTWTGDCAPDGSVTLTVGDVKACTITNTDQSAHIVLIKNVINNNGGNADVNDFGLTVGGSPVNSGDTTNVNSNSPVALNEVGLTGYNFVSITGDTKCPAVLGGTVTLDEGEIVTCTITNDDVAPTITLTKIVINDNGGGAGPNDFGISVGGGVVSSDSTTPVEANTPIAIDEAGLTGYDFVSITGAGCPTQLGGTVTLSPGQNISCLITNDDQAAHLIVIKHVITDNGGTAIASNFAMTINDVTATGGNTFAGSESGTSKTLTTVGSYSVSEIGPSGYGASYSNDCSGTIALGEIKTCTVTNDDIAPSLTLNKVVVNSGGADKTEDLWTLFADGQTSISGPGAAGSADVVSGPTFSAGTYALSESGPLGYTPSGWSCSGNGSQSGNSITLDVGQSAVCTITNSSIAPTLTLNKLVDINWGGTEGPSSFTLTVDGSDFAQGVATPVTANAEHTINELTLPGYTFVSITGDDLCPDLLNGIVTLTEGQNITCTITNEDLPAHLTVIKHVITDNGGDKTAADFTMFVAATNVSQSSFDGSESGTTVTLNKGSYSVTENELPGYTASYSADCSGTIDNDQSKTCEITNDDQTGRLVVVKVLINDDGGNKNIEDFSYKINDGSSVFFEADGQNESTVNSDNYTIVEDPETGYETTYDNCDDVFVPNGGSATCTITNDDIAPTLKLVKEVVNDNGGTAGNSDWTLRARTLCVAGDPNPACGFTDSGDSTTFHTLAAGRIYSLSESGPAGYTMGSWSCDGGSLSGNRLTLGLDDNATCTITNDDIAPTLKLVKFVEGGNSTPGDWTLRARKLCVAGDPDPACGFTDSGDSTTFHTLAAGKTYTLSESGPSGYSAGGWSCDNTDVRGNVIVLSLAQVTTCSITNTRDMATVTIDKVTDPSESSELFTINLNQGLAGDPILINASVLADQDTPDTYLVPTGEYWLQELDKTGWQLTNAICTDGDESFDPRADGFNLTKDASITCTFTNTQQNPLISITKSNNAGGGISAGATVTYTLTVKNDGNLDLYNILVTDFLPGGFSYVDGSTTGATFINVIGPKISWNIDNLGENETAIITYQAKTDSSLSNGDYMNYATCQALYGNEETIACDPVNSRVTIGGGPSYGGNLVGQVLGISTELPGTGSPTALLALALGLLTAGFIIKKKYVKN